LRIERSRNPILSLEDTEDNPLQDPNELRDETERLVYEALDLEPDRRTRAGIRALQAQMLFDDKNYRECVEYSCKALKLNSRLAGAYDIRGQAYEAIGQKRLALEDYTRKLKLDPWDDLMPARIRNLEKELGVSEESQKLWNRVRSVIGKRKLWTNIALA
jgi:tetratricopeptide (TPR) repeat protein